MHAPHSKTCLSSCKMWPIPYHARKKTSSHEILEEVVIQLPPKPMQDSPSPTALKPENKTIKAQRVSNPGGQNAVNEILNRKSQIKQPETHLVWTSQSPATQSNKKNTF